MFLSNIDIESQKLHVGNSQALDGLDMLVGDIGHHISQLQSESHFERVSAVGRLRASQWSTKPDASAMTQPSEAITERHPKLFDLVQGLNSTAIIRNYLEVYVSSQ